MKKNLKPARKEKLERKIAEKDLLGRKKKIYLYPIRTDTSYVVLKAAESSTLDAVYERKVKEYLLKSGFKRRPGRESDFYQNDYFLSVYWGKLNQFSSKKCLKFQATGQFLIHKGAERTLRELVKDIKAIFTENNVLCDWRFTRVDVSYLILAKDIYDILPRQEEFIFLSNNMQPRVSYYTNSESVSGITYSNSALQLMVYDKEFELDSNMKNHSPEYIEYHQKYIAEAKRRKMKLYRLELKVSSQRSLVDFQNHFFSSEWDEESNKDQLRDIFDRFFKTHSFRRPPKNQVKIEDKRNRGRWEIDPITENLFTNGSSTIVLKAKRQSAFKSEILQPKKNKDLDEIVRKFAKDLARFSLNFTDDDFEYLMLNIIQQYNVKKYDETISVFESIKRQTSWRLLNAQSEAEIKLIIKEKNILLKKMDIKGYFHYKAALKELSKDARDRIRKRKEESKTD